MASSQHRCVFVGNIPYDATEEQLIEICQEVGPVVSFRLVIDRETGKPKGYGFCEYKDEETALSARRNLQGYEINGRQLRVDFAENDKGSDRNREQGRGGPGLAANSGHGESVHNQPIGLHIAITAAAVMTGALGGPQASMLPNQNGLQQSALANDPLTLRLAKLSRNQLTELLTELKGMAMQNKESARQLLLARPQLSKALFQAEIMLGLVPPQVLEMPNLRQAPIQPSQPAHRDAQLSQQQAFPTLSALPPLAQRTQPGLMPKVQPIPSVPQNSFGLNQFSGSSQAPMQPQVQLPQPPTFQQGTLPGPSGALSSIPVRPVGPVATVSSANLQTQSSSVQHPRPVGAADLGYNPSMGLAAASNRALSLIPPRPSTSDAAFQPGSLISSGIPGRIINDAAARSSQIPQGSSFNMNGQSSRPSKLMKLEDGRGAAFPNGGPDTAAGARAPPVGPPSFTPVPKPEGQYLEEQIPQPQLPPDVESALLQQVMSLTSDQLSSLPPEQQQQVLQLQQKLRRDQWQPS
ncbi:cleavage stimulating factor 64 isoform X2 [Punica granatum]|uniref:RRM domain-containing protein n=2 Tax=Punica granatum TaxID=22663 RepID=A0A218XI72_PUNGR|nr:cleavage stimulating factor 64 isoform X2 [Punica granatum]OWM84637.1 hypothetical protein CDL15_Pgr027424 [Punica granatum]PKI69957.1 hypothetical protein CRG98_009832 [Punica granatum]